MNSIRRKPRYGRLSPPSTGPVTVRAGPARSSTWPQCTHAAEGLDEALSSFRWAVAELEAADVYPTLILCAARVLACPGHRRQRDNVGRAQGSEPDPAARHPRRPRHQRSANSLDGLLGPGIWKPDDLYREAAAQADSASGYYNHNIKLATPAGPVIVRIPIPGSDVMDLAIWPESSVLRAIRDLVTHAPRLLYAKRTSPVPGSRIHRR